MLNHYGINNSGLSLLELLKYRPKDKSAIAQHLRQPIPPKRSVEKKDRRFFKLPLSTRILQSLPSLRSH
jgi:hypothetical protein